MRPAIVFILAVAMLVGAPASGPGVFGQSRPPAPTASQIDLNSASRDQLMELEGIGEVRADAIIRARPFKVKGDLVERRIIPEALYERIADKIAARAPAAPAPAARGAGSPAPGTQRR